MLHKTTGIVLNTFNYNDNSVIAKIYTSLFGLQSFIVSRTKSKKADNKTNILQPLSLVELVIYHKEQKQMHRIKEIKIDYPFTSIPYDISKSSIVLFLNEIIYKAIKEEEANENLFHFLKSSLQILDLKTEHYVNFHLLFLVNFSKYLGFFPQGIFSENNSIFNLQEGVFQSTEPNHPYYLSRKESNHLYSLMNMNYDTVANFNINNTERKTLLEKLILFYELHLHNIKGIKSHQILEEVIN